MHLQVLDLQPGADAKSIKAAVRRLVRMVHPDKCSLPGAEEAFKSVLKAAERISVSDTGMGTVLYVCDCTPDSVPGYPCLGSSQWLDPLSPSSADVPVVDHHGGNWWEEWDDPEQLCKKRKAQDMEQQHGEAHTIWWLQLQELSVQASTGTCICTMAAQEPDGIVMAQQPCTSCAFASCRACRRR